MVPPEITDSTPDLELKQGSSAKLACHADGVPTPGISWMREHKRPIKAVNKKGDTRKCKS